MHKDYIFNSKLSSFINTFIKLKSIGDLKVDHLQYTYKQFDEYLISIRHNREYINKAVYDSWFEIISLNSEVSTIYRKVSSLRMLLIFISQQGTGCYIPRLPRKHKSSFIPYIYSHTEIRNIFKASDEMRAQIRQPRSILIAIPAILRLLYSTAIRSGEALDIRIKDIDFDRQIITLNRTKNGKQRLAPINKSLETILKQYLKHRAKLNFTKLSSPDSYLFVSGLGNKCSGESVNDWFKIIRERAGIRYKGGGHGPRVHDIRHTACVHSMVNMHKAGKDIYCCLPILSTFMGHSNIYSTETYLRLSQEYYPEVAKIDTSITAVITQALIEKRHE